MTILARLDQWKESGALSAEQHSFLFALAGGELVSVFLELNILLYAGILAFVGGLGWTISTWSEQIGDVLVISVLAVIFGACFWYCFSRGPAWSPGEVPSPSLIFDYVLYLGCLVWSLELSYIETRLHFFSGQWDNYLLASAALFFFMAYRFDNRFVLSLALSSLAGWFGLNLSHWADRPEYSYRHYAIAYSFVTFAIGAALRHRGWKAHFFGTYLNIAANVLFWAILSGILRQQDYGLWLLALAIVCAACLAWGIPRREFAFIAYAAFYGYIGISSVFLRGMNDAGAIFIYFMFTGIGMLTSLVQLVRKFGREA